MEKMPFRDAAEVIDVHAVIAAASAVTASDWRQQLPALSGSLVTLRELRLTDAPSLLAMLSTEEVTRFISPPPIGLFQVRELEPNFATAEWGFAIGSPFWGSGVFVDAANLVVEFAFDELGTHRLEARAAIGNGRGNGALRKIGALQEGVLRKSFLRNGVYQDQVLWAILDEDWRRGRSSWSRSIH
jgi:RimJ/RimL family protein N-acetyltransferase